MKTITLTQSKFAIIDDIDFDLVRQYVWRAQSNGRGIWYATTSQYANRKQKVLAMHNLINPPTPGLENNHKNWDGLDNRRENLELVTHRINTLRKRNNSTYGSNIRLHNRDGVYEVEINLSGFRHYSGGHATLPEAITARDGLYKQLNLEA